jgi:hypothetical protein
VALKLSQRSAGEIAQFLLIPKDENKDWFCLALFHKKKYKKKAFTYFSPNKSFTNHFIIEVKYIATKRLLVNILSALCSFCIGNRTKGA